jgi:hypothetical protein
MRLGPQGYIDPPPYPPGTAPFGGQPVSVEWLLHTHGKRTIHRWEFTSTDPHLMHHMNLRALPDGRYSLSATATREMRAWTFPTLAEAAAAAQRMRAALIWPGEWTEITG